MDVPIGLTWSLKKIWAIKEIIAQANGVGQFIRAGKFRVQKMYQHLRYSDVKVPWRRISCNNKASPKATFIACLAIQNRITIKEKLIQWNVQVDSRCVLCQTHNEYVDHLFFACSYSAQIRRIVFQRIGTTRSLLAG